MERCPWCGSDPLYIEYHDKEWGSPVHDERKHFEFLLLETQQAGLSWLTILKKREAYREAFYNFEPERVARLAEADVARMLENPRIVRNRRKLAAAVVNARHFLEIQEKYGSFDAWIWDFVDGCPVNHGRKCLADLPVTTELSDKVSAELKRMGFAFVGSTTIYAHLQAIGMVNDHLVSCFRWKELSC